MSRQFDIVVLETDINGGERMNNNKVSLNLEVANRFRNKAKRLANKSEQDMGEFRRLKTELMDYCDVTEMEAINILRGYHIMDYIRKYEIMSGIVTVAGDAAKRKENRELLIKIAELEDEVRTAAMANEGIHK